jgi:hypothetical protein
MCRPFSPRTVSTEPTAPDIVSAILSGKQPPELTARRLMDDTRLPRESGIRTMNLGHRIRLKSLAVSGC